MELLKKNHQQRHGIVSVQNTAFVPGVNALLRVKYLRHVFSSVALNLIYLSLLLSGDVKPHPSGTTVKS